jgi:hypothetical protein
MAVKTSGQLSLRDDIRAEVGGSTSNISLGELSRNVGFSRPDAMSEFYGYSAFTRSRFYWRGDGINDTLRRQGVSLGYSSNQDLTWSGWYRLDSNGTAVEQLGSISTSSPNGSNQFFLQYDGRFNRIYWRYRYNGTFAQRQYPLHDNPNRAITGIQNSSPGWSRTQPGNANAEGFVHLTFTWDQSNTSVNALQVYWNAQQLTNSVNNRGGVRNSWTGGSVAVGDLVSSPGNNANVWQGGIDSVAIWNRVLSQSEITAMYNGGTPTTPSNEGVTSGLLADYRFEENSNNSAGAFPNLQNNNGGQYVAY